MANFINSTKIKFFESLLQEATSDSSMNVIGKKMSDVFKYGVTLQLLNKL